MEAWKACYHFAGFLGVDPYRFTLRELWLMRCGKKAALREHALCQAALVWGDEDLDVEAFLQTGTFRKSRTANPPISKHKNEEINAILAEAKEHGGLIQVKPKKTENSDAQSQ